MFTMRFDMRSREGMGARMAKLYEAALEMAAWGEQHGCVQIQVSEHHAASDGYLPAPIVLAAAIAARTQKLPIQVAALLLPLHDPVALAEQMCVVDNIAKGRCSYVCALGYRPEEYQMFGRAMAGRGARMEECLQVLQQAFRGEPFVYRGRRVHVTPPPFTPGGPPLMLGGGAKAAVRRAAKFGLGMVTMGGGESLEGYYRAACKEFGTAPGAFIHPQAGVATSAFVAENVDAAWQEIGPYLLHDAQQYAAWLGANSAATKSAAQTVAELRAEAGPYRIFTPEQAAEEIRRRGVLLLQPLCGGIPPKLAWRYLQTAAEVVQAQRG